MGVVINLQNTQGRCNYVFCGSPSDPQVFAGLGELDRCCLLRTLLSYNGRDTAAGGGILRPDLAATLPEVSGDGLTWTFHLRRGIHYGPPLQHLTVTAQDFVRSLERLLSPEPASFVSPGGFDFGPYFDYYLGANLNLAGLIVGAQAYGAGHAQHVSGLQAPDDHTLVVHLTQASGNLGYLLAHPDAAPIPPVPEHPEWRFGAAQGHAGFYTSYLVSTGPYMIEGDPQLDFSKPPQRQAPARGDGPGSLTLVRNPSWRPSNDPLRVALPDRIQLVPVKDPAAAKRLIRRGVIDLTLNWGAPSRVLSSDAPTTAGGQVEGMTLNLAMPPLDDPHVRRAISFAIARRSLLGIWRRFGPAEPQTHIGLDNQENNLLLNFDPYHAATGNLKEARREMALSGYDRNHDGRCDGSVCRGILLWANPFQPPEIATARKIAPQLKRIGLHVRAYSPDPPRFFAPYTDPHVHAQMVLGGVISDDPGPTSYFAFGFASPSTHLTGGFIQNLSRIGFSPAYFRRSGYHVTHVPSVDGRIEQCLPLTFAQQTRCFAEFDQYLTKEILPVVPLVKLVSGRLTSSRVARFNFDPAVPTRIAPSLDRVVLQPHTKPAPLPSRPGAPPIPEGVYRYTMSRADRLRFDVRFPHSELPENTGTTTVYLRNGRFEAVHSADHYINKPIIVGTYGGRGHHVTFHIQYPTDNDALVLIGASGHGTTVPTARWRFDGHALHFKLLGCGSLDRFDPSGRFCRDVRAEYEAHPWVKVADLP